ncbi:hypothetical protein HMPREF9714_00947 [Myroides odoratimimus CCUG 12901]|uniref:hypothetical protein n=1 Tax=Myroides TaxID=76831 RepID=UPI0002460D47|nr:MULTISPECIES: hypothetical protein [Myroides]EHO13113.1 hypothetical protein HMPREF9714_00947 [Myroides odoratimimus CCUG 12901]MDX4974122.1 hypothetical protein [Myroides odoratimimus]
MNLIDQHIRQHLFRFQDEEDALFQNIVELIQSEKKEKNILLLRYIHLLLNAVFSEENDNPQIFHLHFTHSLNDDSLSIIAQYVLIRLFKESYTKNNLSSGNNDWFESVKLKLNSKLRKLNTCPDGASGKNGGNKIYKNWIKEKTSIKTLIDFYCDLGNGNEILNNTVFNCQVWLTNSINDFLTTNPYACTIDNYNAYPTFNLLNTKSTLNEIDEIDNSIIDNLENVVLFDCERKRMMQSFSQQDMIKDYDVNLKKYLIFSFGNKNNSVQTFRDKLVLIQSRFKITNNESYPILQSEIDDCLKRKSTKYIPVTFVGIEKSSFWDAFLLETNVQDLYELRSIKMMNLYSLCFDSEIKDYILQDIFSEKDTSELISEETKQRLLNLRYEDLSTLRNCLGNILELIISSDMKQSVSEKIKSETTLFIDVFILKSKQLRGLISKSLSLKDSNKLISWSELIPNKYNNIIILSYQDQGKFPYYFYPNVIETTVLKDVEITAIYHKFLFLIRYQWAKYNVTKDLYKLLDHPLRQKYFQWERLKKSINAMKPEIVENTNWDLEQQYSGNTNRETIKLKLKGEREKTFNCSDLFIYSRDKKVFKVDKIGNIIEAIDEDEKYFVHYLDEIQERINLYEKIMDRSQQDEELNIIRQQFEINETDSGRLWKLLLKQKASTSNEEALYEELKNHFETKGVKIVSLHHFTNNWINPESDSIAPISKKVFIELCNFLGLPPIYFTLIRRLKNASKQSNRQSTRQMNRLLQDLFNDSSFDESEDIDKIITANLENYKRKHPLDELGIDERYLGDNLVALVELIKPEIVLKEMEKFKKVE